MTQDIRWEQRFSNFRKALAKLKEAVHYFETEMEADIEDTTVDEIIREGVIQRFEYTHELAWNVMKDYAFYQGNDNIGGSRDATREAFQLKLIADGKVWMDMIASRNKTSHTYNEDTANEIFTKVIKEYYPAFTAFESTMETKRSGQQGEMF